MVVAYYQVMLVLSILCTFLYIWNWRRNASTNYLMAFILTPIACVGYLLSAHATTVGEAVMGTKIVYIGGCFLPLVTLLGELALCGFEIKNWVRTLIFAVSFCVYGMVLSIGNNDLFYRDMYFTIEDGIGVLHRSYGPFHTVFYCFLIAYPIVNLAILIYSLKKKPEVSFKNIALLFLVIVVGVVSFFITRIFDLRVEIMPLAYVVVQVLFLMVCERTSLYSISSSMSESILEHGTVGLISFDRKKNLLVSNQMAKQILPQLKKSRVDTPLNTKDKDFATIDNWIEQHMADPEADQFYLERNGNFYECRIFDLMSKKRVMGYYVLIMDVTIVRQNMEYMKKAADAAIAADKAKSQFLTQMSHEIRTPINAVLGMNEMILRESKDEDILDYSRNIQSAGKNLLSIINSILDFSRIEDGKMEILPARYDLASMINNLTHSISERAREKNLEFEVEVDETLPSALIGDDVRVTQVIMNLLTNAVKYTEEGTVTLSIKEAERAEGNVVLSVMVRDTGIGIKEEDMGRLFRSFERLDAERNRNVEGTGLGMAIVTRLLDLMDSKLEVKSVYGLGSDFSFLLKQEIADEEPLGDYAGRLARSRALLKDDQAHVYAPKARILVVDDNEMNRKVAVNLMKRNGFTPDLTASGAETIERMRKEQYDIVFLDHMMPEMDGVETLKRLKKEKLIPEGTVLIALTANAVSGARERYLAAGFDGYLSKPIEGDALEETLSMYLPEDLLETEEPKEAEEEPKEAPDDFATRLTDIGLDTEMALSFCVDDWDFYREVLQEYVAAKDEKLGEMDHFLAEENWYEFKVSVHALKSTSRMIGAATLAERAQELENFARDQEAASVKEFYPSFRKNFISLTDQIGSVLPS
jgi:signal transduction histidine kinase/DNA-binding NarL/FixJ family response regulator